MDPEHIPFGVIYQICLQ